jgi:Sep15/SelM redox domain
LNRYPELKSFLKDGEAEQYAGIKVTYVAGRTAVLTIYQDKVKQEEVVLHELKNKAAMHELFRQKGFVLKSELAKQGTGPNLGVAKADATTTIAAAAKEIDAAAGQQANPTLSAQQQQEAAEAAAIQVLRLGAAAALRRQDNAEAAATGGGGRGRRKKNNNARNKKQSASKAAQQAGVVVDGGGAGSSSWSEMLQLYAFLTAAVLLAAGSYKGLRGRHRAQGIGGIGMGTTGGGGSSSSRLWRRAR